MLKKDITFTNPFTGEQVIETHYFNLSKAELIELEMGQEGGLGEHLKRIIAANDGAKIMAEFKKLLLQSHGKKVGDRFVKTDETREEFASSEAYSEFFTSLVTDAAAAAEFVNGIVPSNLDSEVDKIKARMAEQAEDPIANRIKEFENGGDPTGLSEHSTPRVLTKAEVEEMDSDELKSGIATGRYKLS